MDDLTSHLDLIEGARAFRQAALAADLDGVHAELCTLRNALNRHSSGEDDSIVQLSPAARRVAADGQRRLRGLVDALLSSTAGGDPGCECLARADELFRLLNRQARLENGLFAARFGATEAPGVCPGETGP